MTPSPEERAAKVVRSLIEPLDNGKPYLETPLRKVMAEVIASAIREAENAALESAAVLVEKRIVMKHLTGKTDLPELHIAAIRSLKSKD